MIRRVFDAQRNKAMIDDKDYFGNKRIEQNGSLIGMLFEDLFKTFNQEVKKAAETYIGKNYKDDGTGVYDEDLLNKTMWESGKITKGYFFYIRK